VDKGGEIFLNIFNMRALYNTLWSDPWLKISEKLLAEKTIQPVYWIGFYDDDSEINVPQKHPGIIYQSRWDAWKGIFPDEIEKVYTKYTLTPDFLNTIANFELQAMSMMDRMDPDRHRFAFAERQRFFRNLLRKWFACIDIYKIDLVIGDRIPHRPYDFALYLVCTYLQKEYMFLNITNIPNRLIWSHNVSYVSPVIKQKYEKVISDTSEMNLNEISKNIDGDIMEIYHRLKKSYDDATPTYMINHKKNQSKNSNIFNLGMNFIKGFFTNTNKSIHSRRNKGILQDLSDIHPYSKRRHRKIEDSKYNVIQYGYLAYKAIRYKRMMKNYYQSLSVIPDFSKNYICFALHYQPEATSNPSGDIFTDQYLAVEQVASQIPDNWYIYVKEHTSQFLTISEGQKSRFKHHYEDLLKIPNVKLVSLEANPFDLIDNSKAVATITGTVAWEAIIRKKPTIIFGFSWLESYHGIKKIINNMDIESILDYINNYEHDEKALLQFLLTIQEVSPKSYSYMLDGKEVVDEKTCIDNLYAQLNMALK